MSSIRSAVPRGYFRLLVLATPMLLPLAGSDQSKPPKAIDKPEPAEITNIIYRIIANEWQTRTKLAEFSPRVETYLQYYQPDPELGDVATEDAYFLGRLKFSKKVDNKATGGILHSRYPLGTGCVATPRDAPEPPPPERIRGGTPGGG